MVRDKANILLSSSKHWKEFIPKPSSEYRQKPLGYNEGGEDSVG